MKNEREIAKVGRKRSLFFTVVLFILIGGGFCFYYFFIHLERLPKGELVQQVASPTREYEVNIYYVRGSLTTGDSIRGEVVFRGSGRKRTLYWGYHEREAKVMWLGNTTVVIKGRSLDIFTDSYDWRSTG